jgi:hypothetical protein
MIRIVVPSGSAVRVLAMGATGQYDSQMDEEN